MRNNVIAIRLNEWCEIDTEFAQFLETSNKNIGCMMKKMC